MLVLEEVWTGSGTSQQSIDDFWHHAHFAIIQLTADCGISKRKLEVSSLKMSPWVILRLLMALDCPGWHSSTTLNGSWGQCPFLAELQRRSPFANHNSLGGGAHPLIPLLTNSKCAFKNCTWGVDANQPLTLIYLSDEPGTRSASHFNLQTSRYFPKPRCLVSVSACVQSDSSAFDFSAVLLILSNSTKPKSPFFPKFEQLIESPELKTLCGHFLI